MDDWRLLREFVASGSDEAFTELVNRHLGLVYSTALRRLRDAHVAEEVTQSVFTLLAQKARGLRSGVILAAWLYQTACFKAAQHQRTAYRRLTREREAAAMQQINSPSETDAAWKQIEPLLDEAMQQLGEKDRAALLLRYFQQKRLRDVGLALGVEEEAARKRVDRALDKLRRLLAARGVTTSASALTLVLNARVAETIPAVLGSKLARSALIAAGAATTSTLGLLTLMASANLKTAVAMLTGLLVTGAVAVKLYQGSTGGNGSTNSVTVETLRPDAVRRTTSPFSSKQRTALSGSIADETDPGLAAALTKLEKALNDPNFISSSFDPAIQEAIAAFGDKRKFAIPMLRAALKNPISQIRRRGVQGLGLIGPDAKEAAPDIVDMLRASTSKSGASLDFTLALLKLNPSAEILPDLVQIFKENSDPMARSHIGIAIAQVSSNDPNKVDEMVRPLLQDPNLEMRQPIAGLLAMIFKSQAGNDVIQVAVESLKTTNDFLLLSAFSTLENIAQEPNDRERVKVAAPEAIPALIEIANNNRREDMRMHALRLLESLAPDLRQKNPGMDNLLREQEQTAAFTVRILSDQVSVMEIIEGLKQFPNAIPAAAEALTRFGAGAQPALPVLREALAALEPKPGASGADGAKAYRARETVANAIQKIAPDEPKPLFALRDQISVLDILNAPAIRSDPDHRQRISKALKPVRDEITQRSRGNEITPDQMRRFLEALKEADGPTHDAVAAQVKKIDPHFFTTKPAP